MLAVALKFQPKEADKAFQSLVSWGVRILIASSTRSGSVETPFAMAAHEVVQEQIKTRDELRRKLVHAIPNDDEFRKELETTSVSNTKLARYYLRSLEMTAKGEKESWFIPNDDRQVITLEHVLPMRPEGNWPNFSADDVRIYVKRLGNLALLQAKTNSDLKSLDLASKRSVYQQSPYTLTNQIAECTEWGIEQICKRQLLLASLAIKTWPL